MWGLSFIQAGFLAAAAAASVPVLIHLLFRQRARKLTIGSVRFLQRVVREHRRRRRVRQWILLALRCLAVLLLAILFARPFLNAAARLGPQQELVLLVDASASMGTKDSRGNTSFSQALKLAREEIAELDENVVLHLGLFDANGVRRTPLDKLDASIVGSGATDYGLALAWARDVVAASSRAQKRVALISDLQQTGLQRTSFHGLPEETQFIVRDVGQAVSANVALLAADAVRTEIRPKDSVMLRAIVHNFAPLPAKDLKLLVRLNGPQGPVNIDQDLQVEGSAAAVVELPLNITEDGLYSGDVQLLPQDSAEWDNRRYVAFEARHPERVLLVDGQEGRTVFSNETYYLETALRLPSMDASTGLRSFEVEKVIWEKGHGFPSLAGYRAIVMANIRSFSDTDVERLAEYVEKGGNLLLLAGDQAKASDFDALTEAGVFPGRVSRTPLAEPQRITTWPADHPALKPFRDPQHGDLRRLEFRRTLPIEQLADSSSKPFLSSGPRIIAAERSLGRGRCIYVGSSADRDWTNWPQTRLYVPLVRQIMAYLTDQLAERARVTTKLITEQGEVPGITTQGDYVTVHNTDPQESIPDRLTKTQLCEALGIQEAKLAPEEQAHRAAIALPKDALRSDEIWTRVMWCLLATLIAESLLASRVHA